MQTRVSTRELALAGLMAAVLCLLGPWTVSLGPIPLSLANFVIFVASLLLGGRLAGLSVLVYLLLGGVGLPVFSGAAGGFARLAGPTGGYLLGYLPLAVVAGSVARCAVSLPTRAARVAGAAVALLAGEAALYTLGTAWYCLLTGCTAQQALAVCVVPFLLPDGCKLAAAVLIAPVLRRRLQAARVM